MLFRSLPFALEPVDNFVCSKGAGFVPDGSVKNCLHAQYKISKLSPQFILTVGELTKMRITNPRVVWVLTYPNVACCFGGIFGFFCERTVLEDSCLRRKIEVGVRIFGGGAQRVERCMRPVANWERSILRLRRVA